MEEEEEEQDRQKQQQVSAEIETQAAASGGLTTWGLPQGRNTNIHPSVGPAVRVKKSEASHINKGSSPLSVLMMFFTEIFHLLVEQTQGKINFCGPVWSNRRDMAHDFGPKQLKLKRGDVRVRTALVWKDR